MQSAAPDISPLRSPQARFPSPQDQCFLARRSLSSPDWDRQLVTAFPSPATVPAFTSPFPGSMVLTCYFVPSLQAGSARSALQLRHRTPVRPGFGRFFASGPLQFRLLLRLAASPISTPLRGFYPPPDQSVQPVSLPVGPPSESARFPLAPRCQSFFKCGYGSPFLVRYVSGGLLFLKPLGTFFTMLPKTFAVNAFLRVRRPFPQHLFVLFRIGYGRGGVKTCG